MEKYLVIAGGAIFAVELIEDPDLPVLVYRVKKEALEGESVMTVNDFLELIKNHPVLKEIENWDPFWS